MLNFVYVGIGGCIGAVARYGVGCFSQRWLLNAHFPWATFLINVVGCFLIGILMAFVDRQPSEHTAVLRLFVGIGVLGGFTTFSTFGFETWQLIAKGQMLSVVGNVLGQVILGVLAVYGGMSLTIQFLGR